MNKLPTDGGWCDECYARYEFNCPASEQDLESGDVELDDADDVRFCAFFVDGKRALKYLQMNDARNPNPYTRSGLSRLLAQHAPKDAES